MASRADPRYTPHVAPKDSCLVDQTHAEMPPFESFYDYRLGEPSHTAAHMA